MRSCLVTWVLIISSIGVQTEGRRMPDTFTSHQHPSADTGDNLDEDDDSSLIVSRGNDVLTSTQTQTGHFREITGTLTAFNETFVLDLKLNTYLLASTYIEKAITDSGEVYNDVNHVTGHCYYTGQVRNRSQSTAAISTCKGVSGYFAIGNVAYHIEAEGDNLNGRHRIFRNRDDVKNTFGCGTEGHHTWMSSNNLTESFGRSIHRMKRSFLYPQDADRKDKVVEVYVANDRSQYIARSSDVQAVYSRTKEIVNIVSTAYQPLGIYIVLVGVEVWTDRDRFTIQDSNVNEAIYSWYTYRTNSVTPSHYNDNGVLITNVRFSDGILGVAPVGYMCSNLYSASVISDIKTTAAAGAILAHEMGHNFGLQHDNNFAQCSCDDFYTFNHCIMYNGSDPSLPATKWSSCSKTQFATSFRQGMDICLYNIPKTIFKSSPKCGNGIVEDGEQCDCGNAPSSECNKKCCNSATCKLIASAVCASGRCCDISQCKIKSSGTECRSKSNDCDLSESCNGVDARCPTDSYKPDGTDCTNIEPAYCYQGQCRSHRSQCELIWGPGTIVSDKPCYAQNGAGSQPGNCGIRWANTVFYYIACDVKDVKCGMLQCQAISKELGEYQKTHLLKESNGSSSCRAVIFDYGIAAQDPGLVPNGAKCGNRQMCVNQKCVNVNVLPATVSTTTTSTTRSTTSSKITNKSTTKSSITPTKSTRSTTMSPTAKEGAFGVYLANDQTGVTNPLHFDGAVANRLSRYNFSSDSFRSSLISVPQFLYTEICAGVRGLASAQLKTTGAYPPLSFDWTTKAHYGIGGGCRGGVLSVNRTVTISISQNGDGLYSSSYDKETSWSMFSVTDTMKYDSQLLFVFAAKSSSVRGALPFSSPQVNPVSLYNAATTAYMCRSGAPAYFFSMSVGVTFRNTATVQLVISGLNYTFEMTRQNTVDFGTGTTTLARTVLVPCTSEARLVLVDGEVVPGSNLISFTAFPYQLKTGTSVSWAGYRTTDVANDGDITYDLWLVREGISFQVENSVIRIPVSGYYYVYISAGVCSDKYISIHLSGRKYSEDHFGLTRSATIHSGLETIGHGMVVKLSANDLLKVIAFDPPCSSSSGLHTSFIGMLLYQD